MMSNSKISKLFEEVTNFKNEETEEKFFDHRDEQTKDTENYDLNFFPDGSMNLNRTGIYIWSDKDNCSTNKSIKLFRGTYEIIVNNEEKRIIRLNIEFLKDNSSSIEIEEMPYLQTLHFYTNKSNCHSFTYLRNEKFKKFIEPVSLENDNAFHGLELAGETDELINRDIILKYGRDLIDYYEEKFPNYKIKEGLNYLKEKINPSRINNENYKNFWDKVKAHLEKNELILLGAIAKFQGNVFKAYELIEDYGDFKNLNKMLARLNDYDLQKHFELFIIKPTSMNVILDNVIYYLRKTLLKGEFEEYIKQTDIDKLQLEEEQVYERLFEKTRCLGFTNLPKDFFFLFFKSELETIHDYGYDDDEINLKVLQEMFNSGTLPSIEEIIRELVNNYINDSSDRYYFTEGNYYLHLKNYSFPVYKKTNSIKEVQKFYLNKEYPEKIGFFINLGFDEDVILDILKWNLNEEPVKIYDDNKFKLLEFYTWQKLIFLNKIYELEFIRKLNKNEINLNEKVTDSLRKDYSEPLDILHKLDFKDEEKNIRILLYFDKDNLKQIDEQTLFEKALEHYYNSERNLISIYSNNDLKFYKSFLHSGKSNFKEYIKESICERFRIIIDEYSNLGFNNDEKNTEALLNLELYEESTFEEKYSMGLLNNYFEYSDYYKIYKVGLHKNKKFYEEYYKSGEDFESFFLKFTKTYFSIRLQEIKELGFDDEDKNISIFLSAYESNNERFTINDCSDDLLKIYLNQENYSEVYRSGANNKDFYKTYLKFNKDLYLSILNASMPSMIPLYEKYQDAEYVVCLGNNLKNFANTSEEVENFVNRAYEYLKEIKKLNIHKEFLMDHFRWTSVWRDDLEEIVYRDILHQTKSFLQRKNLDVSSEENLKYFEEFYYKNEENLINTLFYKEYSELSNFLEKFPLFVCLYVAMKNYSKYIENNYSKISEYIDSCIIDIKEKLKIKPDEYDIMLLLGCIDYSDWSSIDSFAEQYKKLQSLKPLIQEIKSANTKLNEAFIVYTLMV